MSSLDRFEGYRFVGLRDTMRVYDREDPDQLAELEARFDSVDLVERKLIQSFAPDTLTEARNRGFRAAG